MKFHIIIRISDRKVFGGFNISSKWSSCEPTFVDPVSSGIHLIQESDLGETVIDILRITGKSVKDFEFKEIEL